MKLNKIIFLSFICLYCLTLSVFSQKALEKPFHEWSKSQAQKILTDPPWAKTYQSPEGSASAAAEQIRREQGQTANRGGGNPRSSERYFGPAPVVIRLHSALPVRQALNRLQQIGVGYDKMDEQKKSEFDAATKGLLECAICKDYYVVTITKFADTRSQSVEEAIFQRMTLEDMKGNVWLENDEDERMELTQFTPPKMEGDSAVFFFARNDDKGNPFLTPQNKSFKFVFNNNFLTAGNPYAGLVPRNFEFKISKMLRDGKIEF